MLAKRIVLAAAALAGSLLLLELGIRAQLWLTSPEPGAVELLLERLAPASDPDRVLTAPSPADPSDAFDGDTTFASKVLHPYLGYVSDRSPGDAVVNRFGFRGIDPLTRPAPDEVRVAIAGGSVAMQVFRQGEEELRAALAGSPAFANRRIRLVALTMGGYKQPQQLMALAWFLALGAHFDVVINLDGFNEVVLPFSDNEPVGVHPAYPRSWQLYQSGGLDAGQALYLSETRALLEEQHRWRTRLGTGLAARSALLLTVLDRIDAGIAGEIADGDARFRGALNEAGLGFQATGPFEPYPDPKALFRAEVAIWKSSSLQMHQLATGAGARYFHFLQPNQWAKDSKPLSGIERRKLAVPGDWPPRQAVRNAYPLLERAGGELRNRGVAFTSLVPLFRDESRTVYRDTCCHFNGLGISAIANEIGRVVAEAAP